MVEGFTLKRRLVYVCDECGSDSSVPHMVKHFATCSKSQAAQHSVQADGFTAPRIVVVDGENGKPNEVAIP